MSNIRFDAGVGLDAQLLLVEAQKVEVVRLDLDKSVNNVSLKQLSTAKNMIITASWMKTIAVKLVARNSRSLFSTRSR
jgi:hypothetical protein